MPNPRLATRYAKSIIDLSIEQGMMDQVFADMQWLQAVCKSNRDFVNLLRSPVVNGETKQKVMDAITENRICVLTSGFIRLLIRKGRESNLPEIASAFISSYKVKKNIQVVKLSTASPVNDETRAAIIEQVIKTGGFEKVELEENVQPNLIGGFVLQVGDKLVDASIAYDLKHIAKQFDNNDFIYKIR